MRADVIHALERKPCDPSDKFLSALVEPFPLKTADPHTALQTIEDMLDNHLAYFIMRDDQHSDCQSLRYRYCNQLKIEGDGIVGTITVSTRWYVQHRKEIEIEIRRPLKPAKFLAKLEHEILKSKEFKGFKCTALENTVQQRIKTMSNAIAATQKTYWLYNVKHGYAEHYNTMRTTQKLESCMAKLPSFFGMAYNGDDIHPLMGYELSDDFRLGLVSAYSPEEIGSVEDYPFIARVVLARHDHDRADKVQGVSYSRVYGNEIAKDVVGQTLAYRIRPVGCRLYGLLANQVTQYPDIISENSEISGFIEDYAVVDVEADDSRFKATLADKYCTVIAPFVDERGNYLALTHETGRSLERHGDFYAVELTVIDATDTDNLDGDDPDDYYQYLKMDYSTGALLEVTEWGDGADRENVIAIEDPQGNKDYAWKKSYCIF